AAPRKTGRVTGHAAPHHVALDVGGRSAAPGAVLGPVAREHHAAAAGRGDGVAFASVATRGAGVGGRVALHRAAAVQLHRHDLVAEALARLPVVAHEGP